MFFSWARAKCAGRRADIDCVFAVNVTQEKYSQMTMRVIMGIALLAPSNCSHAP